MSSCFGRRRRTEDRQPLLPQYDDDTSLQRALHQKLHTYQMIRAIGKGYLPSTEQLIVNLRTLLAADVLNPDNPDLGDSGRLLVKYTKQLLQQVIDLLRNKNGEDQIQDFLWLLSKSRVTLDVQDIAHQASKAKARADTAAAYRSLQTVGSLLLTNSDFRLFLADLNVIGREVLRDSAFKLSDVAEEAGKQLEPSENDQKLLQEPGADAQLGTPTGEELGGELVDVSQTVGNGAAQVAIKARDSLVEHMGGNEKETLINRLKQVVLRLRKRTDYSDSVSTISLLIKRYAMVYSRAVNDTITTAQDDVDTNPEMEQAVKNFWSFLTSFGEKKQWEELEASFEKVKGHSKSDPEFENLLVEIGNSLEKLLTDPDFLEHVDEKFDDLREKAKSVGPDSPLREDVDIFLKQAHDTFRSVYNDKDVHNVITGVTRLASILSPTGAYVNGDLFDDALNVFLPYLISAVQYIPIPRIEVSTPEVDLLLENLIIEPGKTVNHTSFFPYKLRVETYNDLEIRKAKFRTTSKVTSLVTIKIDGLSMRAEEVGFWLRAHSGLLRLADEGLASFELDERGIDIHLDVEIGREKLEKILTLKAVRVNVHKLSYTLRKSKFSFLGWLFKPLLRPIIRKVMEKQLAGAIADGLHAANRELLYARERLRATRISDPQDIRTFVKAILARLTPEDDPDLYTRVGVAQPGKGVFKGVYAPGSMVKLWNEEAAQAGERVDDYDRGGWRNEVFDVHTMLMT